jgi:hypothetical protein
MGNAKKTKTGKRNIKDLGPKDAKDVVGGRKAGGSQQEYLVYTLKDVQVTGIATSGNPS